MLGITPLATKPRSVAPGVAEVNSGVGEVSGVLRGTYGVVESVDFCDLGIRHADRAPHQLTRDQNVCVMTVTATSSVTDSSHATTRARLQYIRDHVRVEGDNTKSAVRAGSSGAGIARSSLQQNS